MSIRSLFTPNASKLYVNTADDGIKIGETRVKNSSIDNNYTLTLPELPATTPVLLSGTLDGGNVETSWVSFAGGPTVPDPLQINNLTVNNSTTTNTLTANTSADISTVNTSELNIKNASFETKFVFPVSAAENVLYQLPESYPNLPPGDNVVLIGGPQGVLSWIRPALTPITTPKTFYRQNNVDPPFEIGSGSSYFPLTYQFPELVQGGYYHVTFRLTYSKANGDNFENQISVNNFTGLTRISRNNIYFMAHNGTSGQRETIVATYLAQATSTVGSAQFKVDCNAVAGGVLAINNVECFCTFVSTQYQAI